MVGVGGQPGGYRWQSFCPPAALGAWNPFPDKAHLGRPNFHEKIKNRPWEAPPQPVPSPAWAGSRSGPWPAVSAARPAGPCSFRRENPGPFHLPVCQGTAPYTQRGQGRGPPAAPGGPERQGAVSSLGGAGPRAWGARRRPTLLPRPGGPWPAPRARCGRTPVQDTHLGGAGQGGPEAERVGRVPDRQPLLPPVRQRQGEEAGQVQARWVPPATYGHLCWRALPRHWGVTVGSTRAQEGVMGLEPAGRGWAGVALHREPWVRQSPACWSLEAVVLGMVRTWGHARGPRGQRHGCCRSNGAS